MSSILENVFDFIIIKKISSLTCTTEMYWLVWKKKYTIICTQHLIETIKYYSTNNSDRTMLLLHTL